MRGSLLRTGGSIDFFVLGSGWFRDADLVSPGCCRLISCFRSDSVWKTSRASVSTFASVSRVVWIWSQVFVGCLTSCVGGEFSRVEGEGDGRGEYRNLEGAGDGFLEDG
jgi:hypothetical protein